MKHHELNCDVIASGTILSSAAFSIEQAWKDNSVYLLFIELNVYWFGNLANVCCNY